MKKSIQFFTFTCLYLVIMFNNFAYSESEGIIKYRKNVMKSTAGHMGAITDILKNNLPFKEHLIEHARSLLQNSKMTTAIFPKGSETGRTSAKKTIWENWSKFEKSSQAFVKASKKLLKLAENGDRESFAKQVRNTGKTCGSCHRFFRKRN